MLHIVWSLVRRRVTRRLTRLQTTYMYDINIAKHGDITTQFQFTGTTTESQWNRSFRQFNKDQYCIRYAGKRTCIPHSHPNSKDDIINVKYMHAMPFKCYETKKDVFFSIFKYFDIKWPFQKYASGSDQNETRELIFYPYCFTLSLGRPLWRIHIIFSILLDLDQRVHIEALDQSRICLKM